MPVTTTHPQYDEHLADWELMRDSLKGEEAVKAQGVVYLPKTSGQLEVERQASRGEGVMSVSEANALYQSYKARAQYPLWVKDSLRTMMGLVARQEPEIELPRSLAYLEDVATADGFGLKTLFLRTVADCLVYGRKPLLADFDDMGKAYVAAYSTLDAINWRESDEGGRRDLVLSVLRESVHTGDEFSHDSEERYRVLDIDNGYRVRLMDKHGELLDEPTPGTNQGPLDFIPLVYVGSTDNAPGVDEVPLLTMAKAALKSYQLSADYYTSLHYTGHPQPWIAGDLGDKGLSVTGPMAAWELPDGGQVGYLEFSGPGIEATRTAMEDQRNAALEAGARVIDVDGQESGEARQARQNDQHTSLYSVVVTAAEGVQQVLRYIAEWLQLPDVDQIVFRVQPEFTPAEIDAAMMGIVRDLRLAGEVPREVLFDALRKSQVTSYSDEDMQALLDGMTVSGDE